MYIGLKVKWWPGGTLVIICECFIFKKKFEKNCYYDPSLTFRASKAGTSVRVF